MDSVLITGGAGFIGSHLSQLLLNNQYSITIIDDFSRESGKNIRDFSDEIEVVTADITDVCQIRKYIRKSDYVFHLAALSRVIPSIENPELCVHSNIVGTEIIARLCARYRKKLIFSSSREVYGNTGALPVSENHPLSPINPYGASKVAGEAIIRAYAVTFDLDFIILRLANVYGEGDVQRVIPQFIGRAIQDTDITIFGGKQVIDFVYIDDVINAFIRCMDPGIHNEIINIGSSIRTTLPVLADLIISRTSSRSQVVLKEPRAGEVDQFTADITRAKYCLDWEPVTPLDKGLATVIAHAR
jgi:UDP-glucose 4-epimerase